jgi:hypothetical protein
MIDQPPEPDTTESFLAPNLTHHEPADAETVRLSRRELGKLAAAGMAASAIVSVPAIVAATAHAPEAAVPPAAPSLLAQAATPTAATAATSAAIPPQILASIGVPASLETSLGTLSFVDGIPTAETVSKAYDALDLMRGVDVFLNAYQGASTVAISQGMQDAGVPNNAVVVFPELMDAKSLFLTANADTIYFVAIVDLTSGPMVVETPPQSLGLFDDMWFNWIIDFGFSGPDRGAGGKFLLVPPDYDGLLPDSGFYVGRSGTTRALLLGRQFLDNGDPAPTVARIKQGTKIYPYTPNGFGTSIATILEGGPLPAPTPAPLSTTFVEARSFVVNTVPASDFTYFQQLDTLVQAEPAAALDPELMGQMAAIGIVKGKPFAPDERMRKILTDAAALGAAMARTLSFRPREAEGFAYYPNSRWFNPLWVGGYTFETPPPLVTADRIEPLPPTGVRTLNARTAFFYPATGVTPSMIMRLANLGSQYLFSAADGKGNAFDGGKTYRVTLPRDIPQAKFWSLTVYDNQTRSMLDTPQRYPRAGSQDYPTPAAAPGKDDSTTVYFAPKLPNGVNAGNWIQTVPGKGWFTILRLYSPTEAFFDKRWRPSEIVPVE